MYAYAAASQQSTWSIGENSINQNQGYLGLA